MFKLIKSHKIVAATLLVGIVGSTAGLMVINQPVEDRVQEVTKVVDPVKNVEEKVEAAPVEIESAPLESAPAEEYYNKYYYPIWDEELQIYVDVE